MMKLRTRMKKRMVVVKMNSSLRVKTRTHTTRYTTPGVPEIQSGWKSPNKKTD